VKLVYFTITKEREADEVGHTQANPKQIEEVKK